MTIQTGHAIFNDDSCTQSINAGADNAIFNYDACTRVVNTQTGAATFFKHDLCSTNPYIQKYLMSPYSSMMINVPDL